MGCFESQQGGIEESRNMPKGTPSSAGAMGKKGQSAKLKLVYFQLYGKAESIRMLLTHAKVPFEDKRLSLSDRSEFIRMKESGELPSG